VALRIPFDTAVNEAIVQGVPVVEFSDGPASRGMAELWEAVNRRC